MLISGQTVKKVNNNSNGIQCEGKEVQFFILPYALSINIFTIVLLIIGSKFY